MNDMTVFVKTGGGVHDVEVLGKDLYKKVGCAASLIETMKGSEGPSAVTLQARLPTSETISIEAVASEEMKKVKERIASMGGLDVDSFTLTFDGEVVAATAADDGGGQLVGDLPFEDGSMLEVVVSKRQAALLKLSEIGIEVKGRKLYRTLDAFSDLMSKGDEIADEKMCEVVNLLLDAGVSGGEEQALHMTAQHNLPSCVDVLLTRTSVDVNSEVELTDDWGETHTALHRATSEVAAVLISRHNADVNARDREGVPVIHYVARWSSLGKLSVLLEHNADVNARDKRGRTALHVSSAVVHLLPKVHLLLEHKADIEAKDNKGRTPLFSASTEPAKALLERNADMRARDNRGNTCLHHAVKRRMFEVLPVLLRHNADVTARNDEGKTALDLIPFDGRDKVEVRAMRHLLLQNLQQLGRNTSTPLH